jgi:hypothetical protein
VRTNEPKVVAGIVVVIGTTGTVVDTTVDSVIIEPKGVVFGSDNVIDPLIPRRFGFRPADDLFNQHDPQMYV